MKIICYAEKGGAGKTTLAVNLAVTLNLPLLDLDKQATATKWLARRADKLPAPNGALGWVADAPPGISPSLTPTLKAADLVIVPVRASFADLSALADTIKFVRASTQAQVALVLVAIDGRTTDEATLRAALAGYGLPILGALRSRASYRRSALAGQIAPEIDPAAQAEIGEIIKQIGALA